jgi:hypothetical protein
VKGEALKQSFSVDCHVAMLLAVTMIHKHPKIQETIFDLPTHTLQRHR